MTQPNHRDTRDTPQQQVHGAGGPGADEEITEASGLQESDGPPPTTAFHPTSPQQKASTGGVPEEHPDTAQGNPSPAGTTPDEDREGMPPQTPQTTITERN